MSPQLRRTDKLLANKGYDFRCSRLDLRRRDITPRIARLGVENTSNLGKHRLVIERIFAWLNRFCRRAIQYE